MFDPILFPQDLQWIPNRSTWILRGSQIDPTWILHDLWWILQLSYMDQIPHGSNMILDGIILHGSYMDPTQILHHSYMDPTRINSHIPHGLTWIRPHIVITELDKKSYIHKGIFWSCRWNKNTVDRWFITTSLYFHTTAWSAQPWSISLVSNYIITLFNN